MQTSQHKKGNDSRRSRTELRRERRDVERARLEEAGEPTTLPHLATCPHCPATTIAIVPGVTRSHVFLEITECCRGVVTDAHRERVFYPARKKKRN